MSSVMPARRRAEKFNDWVEGHAPDTLNDARILEVVSTLRAVDGPTLRADFAAELRELLMIEADTALVRTPRPLVVPGTLAPTQRRRHRRLAVAASAFAVVGATTSVSMAAQNALPGDALYPIKRALENAQTGLASGDAKTHELLSNAASRLNEATALADRDTAESHAAVAGTLEDFVGQSGAAADLALASGDPQQITQLRDFAAASMIELEILNSVLPIELHGVVADAAQLITKIDRRAQAECPACGGAVIDLPQIFLASASAATASGPVVAPRVQPTADTPAVVAPVQLPTVETPVTPEAGDEPAASDTGGTAEQPQLIPDNDDENAKDPTEALIDALGGGTSTNTSNGNPLDPVTSPIIQDIEDAVDGLDDTPTP